MWNKDAGFTSCHKLARLIDLPVSIIVYSVFVITGDLVRVPVTVIINPVVAPTDDFFKRRNFSIFVDFCVFVIVNSVFRLLEVTIQNVIGNASSTHSEPVRDVFERVAGLYIVPNSTNIQPVKINKLGITSV